MKRYLAFISYRHRDRDQQVSLALLKGLEGYHLPKDSGLPGKRRVFRDADELPTGTDLGANIEGALDDSEWLIAVCSEEYVRSQWCLLEIKRFVNTGRKDRILPVLLSGTPETSVPEEIRDLPPAADLRGKDLSYDRKKLPGAVPELLARMTAGTEKALQSEDFAAAERSFRWKAASGTAACILAGILGLASYAFHTADLIREGNVKIAEATEQTNKARAAAEQERNTALLKNAQYISEQAMAEYNAGNDNEAIRLALSVLPEDPEHSDSPLSTDALGVLRMTMSRPRDIYRLQHTAETDFDITGFLDSGTDQLLLLGEDFTKTETYLIYETGELSEKESEVRKQAFENGYSRGYAVRIHGNDSSPSARILCGPEQPAEEQFRKNNEPLPLTLHGEPFYMDSFVQEPLGELYFAWLEHPGEGQLQKAALFSDKQTEAVAEIALDGAPLCAEISADYAYHTELAVVDREGILRFYDTATGKLKTEVPGRWSAVHYPGGRFQVCAAAADGSGWSLLDTGTGEALLTVETPSPVRQMMYCKNKSALLVRCDDGARIYDMESGRLLNEFLTGEELRFAVWSGADGGRFSYDGNGIVLGFPRRAEIWTLETETDTDAEDAIPLYKEGIFNWCEQAFYSKDGKKVFLQMRDGTLAAFDAGDGSFLWANQAPQGTWSTNGSHKGSVLSADGSAIWRSDTSAANQRDRIDTESGETVYSIKNAGSATVLENPEQNIGVFYGVSWESIKGFDLTTGEVLWEDEELNSGSFYITGDGSEVLQYSLDNGTKEIGEELLLRRRDARTGKITEEKCILRLTDAEFGYFLQSDPEEPFWAVYALGTRSTPAGLPIYIIDVEKGEISAEIPAPGVETEVFFAEKGLALRWLDEDAAEEGWQYENVWKRYTTCCRLEPDGTLGESMPADGEGGRRLIGGRLQMAHFAGEEVLKTMQYDRLKVETFTQLRRVSDNALILDAGKHFVALTRAGGSVCIYKTSSTEKFTPVLLLDSDPAALIRKARKRLEVQP